MTKKSRRDYRSVEPANAHQSGIPSGMPPATKEANLRLARTTGGTFFYQAMQT
jgi:hypothetical protein